MNKAIKFTDIKTAAQLNTRLTDGDVLSVGNKYGHVSHLLHNSRKSEEQLQVTVLYTAGAGSHAVTRWIDRA